MKENLANYLVELGEEAHTLSNEEECIDLPTEMGKFNFFDWGFNAIRQPSLNREGSCGNSSSPRSPDLDPLSKELDIYQMDPCEQRKASPYMWWSANAYRLPLLSKLAMKFLSTPPSSVESERVFSIGTQIYSPKRNSIGGNTSEMLMFIVYNLKYFNNKYNYNFDLWKNKVKNINK